MSDIEDQGSFRASRSIPTERGDGAEASAPMWLESFIADDEDGPVVGILIDLPDGSQIWSGECSNALLEQAADQEGSPADSGLFLMVAAKGKPTRPVAQVATVEDGIALARAVAACQQGKA